MPVFLVKNVPQFAIEPTFRLLAFWREYPRWRIGSFCAHHGSCESDILLGDRGCDSASPRVPQEKSHKGAKHGFPSYHDYLPIMVGSALQRTPVEIWETILDFVMYDPDAFELCVDRPATLANTDVQLHDLLQQIHLLKLVCKPWYRYLSTAYTVVDARRRKEDDEGIRYTSRTNFMHFMEPKWKDILPNLSNHQYIYFETPISQGSSLDRFEALLTALLGQLRLRYLAFEFVSPISSSFETTVYTYPRLYALSFTMHHAGGRLPLSYLLRLSLPSLRELSVAAVKGPVDEVNDIARILERFGPQLKSFSLQLAKEVNIEDALPFPPLIWSCVPNLELLRFRADTVCLWGEDHFSSAFIPSTYDPVPTLPPTLTTLSLPYLTIRTLLAQRPLVAWFTNPDTRTQGRSKLERFRFEFRWDDVRKVIADTDCVDMIKEELRFYSASLGEAGIRLEDIEGRVIEEIEAYLATIDTVMSVEVPDLIVEVSAIVLSVLGYSES